MYFPYLRGKQYELIALRELAVAGAMRNVNPIIEPVRKSQNQLRKAVETLIANDIKSGFVINPKVGQLVDVDIDLKDFIANLEDEEIRENASKCLVPSVILTDSSIRDDLDVLRRTLDDFSMGDIFVIHWGSTDANAVKNVLAQRPDVSHIFIGDQQLLYRREFDDARQIVIIDGFEPARRNSDYSDEDVFSELQVTYYDMLNLHGFGDFQTIGSGFSESGGPAYAVALHLSYIDASRFNRMYCRHFVSDSNDTTTDPAGKFLEALNKLVSFVGEQQSEKPTPVCDSSAVEEYRDLWARKHFPGLGYAKKLSIKHHIETLNNFLGNGATNVSES